MAASDKTVKALMGFLYGALTDAGDGAVEQNAPERFICWCLPGIPIDPEELRFNIRGLTGHGNTPAEAAEDTALLVGQASRFARLVDFTPDATSVFEEQKQMAAFEHGENSLAGLYERVLTQSLVASVELTAEDKEKLERIHNALYPAIDEVNIMTGEKRHVESLLLTTYKEYQANYEKVLSEYNAAWLKSQNPATPEDALQMTINGPMLAAKRDAALSEWESNGRKSEIEDAQAYISAVTERGLNLWREGLKSRLRTSRLADAFNQQFLITSMVPGDFVSNGAGWSNFSFSHKDVDYFESHKATQWETEASLKWTLSFSGDASGSSTAATTVNNVDSFELSCKIAQIPLIRAWFDPSFIESRAWKFGPSAVDLSELSDGGAPPHGSMVAYPISVIFARDVKVNFAELHDETSELTKSIKAGGKASLGVLTLSGSYKRDKQEKQVQSNITTNGLEVSGLQILGFRCRLLKKSPNPLPSIESWT